MTASRRFHGFAVCELCESLQGEAPSTGYPCVLLRLAGCNLRCTWCDTPQAWDFARFRRNGSVSTLTEEAVIAFIACSQQSRLVITGGEPLLQQECLETVLDAISQRLSVLVETNGTIVPSSALCERIDRWAVSPKLHSSGMPLEKRWNLEALSRLRETDRAWLKFVVKDSRDLEQADACAHIWGWPQKRIILMPCGASVATLSERSQWVASACMERGWRFSPRLQVAHRSGESASEPWESRTSR